MAGYDILAAKKEGYSDAEIAQYLSEQSGANYQAAIDEGYKPEFSPEIGSFINKIRKPKPDAILKIFTDKIVLPNIKPNTVQNFTPLRTICALFGMFAGLDLFSTYSKPVIQIEIAATFHILGLNYKIMFRDLIRYYNDNHPKIRDIRKIDLEEESNDSFLNRALVGLRYFARNPIVKNAEGTQIILSPDFQEILVQSLIRFKSNRLTNLYQTLKYYTKTNDFYFLESIGNTLDLGGLLRKLEDCDKTNKHI
jgi:hypothetical protein